MISEGSFLDPQHDNSSFGMKKTSNLGALLSNSTNSKNSSLSRELFGFRRKARRYFETTTQRFREHCNERDGVKNTEDSKNSLMEARNEESMQSKLMMDMLFEKANNGPRQEIEKVSGDGKYGVHISTTPRSVPELICEAVYHDVHGELLLASPGTESIDLTSNNDKRVVIFQDLPRNTGIKNLLAQIHGGPLEKILYAYDDRLGADRIAYVEIHFLFSSDANRFMHFSRYHLFKVNGIHLIPQWANKDVLELSNNSMEHIRQFVDLDKCKSIQNFDSVGARRCLIMKKYTKKHRPICKELNPKSRIYDLDIRQIKNDFNRFGHILDVSPLISRKICLQISFHDIRSAIEAMKSYETTNSFINDRYYRDWSIWYGKDIVDKPCIEV